MRPTPRAGSRPAPRAAGWSARAAGQPARAAAGQSAWAAGRSARAAAGQSALAALGLAAAAWGAGACSASDCRVSYESNPLVPFRGGSRYGADGVLIDPLATPAPGAPAYYETAPPDGEHLDFNGGARYCIFHNLGRRPFRVEPWVSFSKTGTYGGNEAKPAGNMLEVLHVDACVLIVRNDSCGEYYLRVTVSDPVATSADEAPVDCADPSVERCVDPDDDEQ